MVRRSSFLINVKIYLLFYILEYNIDTLVIVLFTDCKGLWYINMIFEFMILFYAAVPTYVQRTPSVRSCPRREGRCPRRAAGRRGT